MGKSNKFDFTNRATSGEKLGQIIGRDLQKEAEKVRRDAGRQGQRARKQSSGSSGGAFEHGSTTHLIDLKAPNRDLGDDGVCAMADGMEIALRSGTSSASLALEDLDISGNKITTISLARLAPIVRLAKYDLKTVNLSNNSIAVLTTEQAQQWETFLLAFKDCMKLRRLDLSDNLQLSPKALEVFARIHVREPPVEPTSLGGDASVLSLVSEMGEEDTGKDSDQVDSVTGDEDSDGDSGTKSAMVGGTFIKRRCGLRSIPYITLHNTSMTDAGALWLSYALEDHHYPSQLISDLNATTAESAIKTYQQNVLNDGVDWSGNPSVTKEGLHLLAKAGVIREHKFCGDGATARDSLDWDESEEGSTVNVQGHRGSLDSRGPIRSQAGNRRTSMRSIRSEDGGEHDATEFESLRKKLMRHIIGYEGVASVELWNAAVQVFLVSRSILYCIPSTRKLYVGEPLFATEVAAPTDPVLSSRDATANESQPKAQTEKPTERKPPLRESYASKLRPTSSASTGEPEFVITEVTNTPTTPLRLQKPTHRKGAFSDGADVAAVSDKLNALIVRDDSPLRFVRFQQRRIAAAANGYKTFRDPSKPAHLPTKIVERVISFVLPDRHLNTILGEQKWKAVERGQVRSTLMAERDWLKKDKSAQALMLLDSIQCLHYGQ